MASPHEDNRPDRARRFSASATLVAIVCATPVMAVMPGVPPLPRPAVAAVSGNRLVEASPPRVVKRVDAVATDTPCEQRVWPNYDAQCPGPAGAQVVVAPAQAPQAAAVTPVAPPAVAPAARGPETVGAAARPDEPATPPSYSRSWKAGPDETNALTAQRRDERSASTEDLDANYYEPVKPPKRKYNNGGERRIHFGNFGIRF